MIATGKRLIQFQFKSKNYVSQIRAFQTLSQSTYCIFCFNTGTYVKSNQRGISFKMICYNINFGQLHFSRNSWAAIMNLPHYIKLLTDARVAWNGFE